MIDKSNNPTDKNKQQRDKILKKLKADNTTYQNKADELIEKIQAEDQTANEMDYEMISLLVQDARQGVDIAKQYPDLFSKLVANTDFGELFLEVLEWLEWEDQVDIDFPALLTPEEHQNTVKEHKATSRIEILSETNWILNLSRSINQLQASIAPSTTGMRSILITDEDAKVTLMQDEIRVEQYAISVALEIALVSSGEQFEVILYTAFVDERSPLEEPGYRADADLTWADYHGTVMVETSEIGKFPPINLDEIFDNDFEELKAGLELKLRVALK